ncbi:hypothetical protein [Streptomyces sp. NBC_01237]|uniref:hypothetical protein n=1 Tax=Streptomyces sp. NBC_01237 TaxID=2903790 RepID=UPI002DDA1762|nr:hypothetical protein [Streptomyces sp. NBC_01237]WRZ77217.1 hypothetical protein OG251_36765 [Streptomyces sp. NBC_01237]
MTVRSDQHAEHPTMLVYYAVLLAGSIAGAFTSATVFGRIFCPVVALGGVWLIIRHLKDRRRAVRQKGDTGGGATTGESP